MKIERINALSTNEALTLQCIAEYGNETLYELEADIQLPKSYIVNIIEKLKKKGLIRLDNRYDDTIVILSNKGKRMIMNIWPEQHYAI